LTFIGKTLSWQSFTYLEAATYLTQNLFDPKIGEKIAATSRDRCYDFSPKKLAKMLAFLPKLLLVFAKNLVITLFFQKNAHILAENWQKSQKIVITTSTPVKWLKKVAGAYYCTAQRSESQF
jgi:hypothetical protein